MKQPEALELADLFYRGGATNALHRAAADELRRLHEVNQELVEALEGIVEAHVVPSTVCKDRPAYEQAKAALAKARGQA